MDLTIKNTPCDVRSPWTNFDRHEVNLPKVRRKERYFNKKKRKKNLRTENLFFVFFPLNIFILFNSVDNR